MIRVYRRGQGKVFDDTFQTLDDWHINKPSAVSIGEEGISIKPQDDQDVIVIRPFEEKENIVEYDIKYTPGDENDKAGVILYDTQDNAIEFLEVVNGPTHVGRMRFTRKSGVIIVEAEKDGVYELVETVDDDYVSHGFIVKKGGKITLTAHSVTAVKKSTVKVMQLNEGFTVRIGEATAVADVDGIATVQLPAVKYTGDIIILDELDEVLGSATATIYGGDVWGLGTYLRIMRDGKELDNLAPEKLGRIVNNKLEVPLDLANPTTVNARDVSLSVVAYDDHGDEKEYDYQNGLEWFGLAKDDEGKPGVVAKDLFFDAVNKGESEPFWIVIKKDDAAVDFNSVYATIKIYHN